MREDRAVDAPTSIGIWPRASRGTASHGQRKRDLWPKRLSVPSGRCRGLIGPITLRGGRTVPFPRRPRHVARMPRLSIAARYRGRRRP